MASSIPVDRLEEMQNLYIKNTSKAPARRSQKSLFGRKPLDLHLSFPTRASGFHLLRRLSFGSVGRQGALACARIYIRFRALIRGNVYDRTRFDDQDISNP